MTQSGGSWDWFNLVGALAIGGGIAAFSGEYAFAQIKPDTTLGAENSSVTRNVLIKGLPSDRIDGGATRGVNLFHSFQNFNIKEEQGAYFTNPTGIKNILGRVTGGSSSNIFGKLGVLGNANLFLINPNGIIFGPNASLDIRGSFVASTASSLNFANGTQFSATSPELPPLLTINLSPGLQLGTNQPGEITNAGNLAVGQDLTLSGGTVTSTGQLAAPAGQVTVTAVSGDITTGNINTSSSLGDSGDISLTSDNGTIDTSAGTLNSSAYNGGNGGAVTLTAQNDITTGTIETLVGLGLVGNGGDISLTSTAGAIAAGKLDAGTTFGDGGAITLTAQNDITTADLLSYVVDSGSGNGGDISLTSTAGAIDTTAGPGLFSLSVNGNGGDITLKAQNDIITGDLWTLVELEQVGNGGDISLTSTAGAIDATAGKLDTRAKYGNAGAVTLNAAGSIAVGGEIRSDSVIGNGGTVTLKGQSDVVTGAINASVASGNAGSVSINSRGSITTGGDIQSSSANGNGGAVTLKARNDITTGNISTITSKPENTAAGGEVGNAGDISLTSKAGAIDTTAGSLDAGTGFSNGGAITLKAYDDITTANLLSYVVGDGKGNSGDIFLTSTVGAINTIAGTLSSFSSYGDAGNITLSAADSITAGDIQSFSFGSRPSGNVNLTSDAEVYLANSFISSETRGSGKGGEINITTGSLFVTEGAELITSTRGKGNAGNMTINADIIVFDGGQEFITLESQGSVPGPRFLNGRVPDGRVSLADADAPYSGTRWRVDEGSDGTITLESRDLLPGNRFLDGRTGDGTVGLVPNTNPPYFGTKWKVNKINDGIVTLEFQENFLDGRTGDGTVGLAPSTDNPFTGTRWSVEEKFISSKVYSRVEAGAEGLGGNIHIKTGSLSVTNGAFLSASTDGVGDAGNVTINARDIYFAGEGPDLTSSGVYSQVLNGARGQGGKIQIEAESLSLTDGAALSTRILTGAEEGQGGNIDITTGTLSVTDNAQLTAETLGVKKAGNLTITTGELLVQDGGEVTVSGQQGPAGNLIVIADSILLDKGKLTAVTGAGEGGNITLGVPELPLNLLLMQNKSEISAEALGTANGGNIGIDTDLLVALENSDISARAEEDFGGRVEIDAQGIFGTEFRNRRTSESDITASSDLGPEFNGTVDINTLDVDPSQGVAALPEEVVDASGLVTQRCPAGSGTVASRASKFVVTGRGGLPPSPSEPPISDTVLVDWITFDPMMEKSSSGPTPAINLTTETAAIVEAQGWVRDSKGQVVLTAQASTVTPHSSGHTQASCPGS